LSQRLAERPLLVGLDDRDRNDEVVYIATMPAIAAARMQPAGHA